MARFAHCPEGAPWRKAGNPEENSASPVIEPTPRKGEWPGDASGTGDVREGHGQRLLPPLLPPLTVPPESTEDSWWVLLRAVPFDFLERSAPS